MSKTFEHTNSLRLLLPELIRLEPEQFDIARNLSQQVIGELKQWEIYLNLLATLGFSQWLNQYIPEPTINQDNQINHAFNYIQLGEFKFYLIVTEHLLDELVTIPEDTIIAPGVTAHIYVIIEVLEEQAEVTIRGILRYDQIIAYRDRMNLQPRNGYYQIPLLEFDPEPNHILFYCRFLNAKTIALPQAETIGKTENSPLILHQTRTKLSQWVQGIIKDEWQLIDALFNPGMNLFLATRSNMTSIKRGKILNLGMQLDSYPVVMLVNIQQQPEETLGVLIQLHPSGRSKFLRPNLKLTLLSQAGKSLCEVISRSHDNYIQLNPFQGEQGKQFTIKISWDNFTIKEDFEL